MSKTPEGSSGRRLPVAKPVPTGRPAAAPAPALPPMPGKSAQPAFQINVGGPPKGSSGPKYTKRKPSSLPVILMVVCALLLVGGAGGVAAYVVLSDSGSPTEVAEVTKTEPRPATSEPVVEVEAPAPVKPATAPVTPMPAAQPSAASETLEKPSPPAAATPSSPDTEETEFQFKPMLVTGDPPAPGTTPPTPATTPASPSLPAPPAGNFTPAGAAEDEQFNQAIVELHTADKLLVKKEYPALRKLFAERFARQHEGEIKQGLGADYDAMQAWFAEHAEIQEELYTAIRPEADKIPAVMQLFNELRKAFPEQIVPYANLAIATSVVWDEERRGVYSYEHHARRCKANLPENLLAAIENFKYLVGAESVMQGRIRHVPWEFLVHVVNHRTPQQERVWAVQNFVGKRVMYGKCYSDVPYDYEMLNSRSESAKLNNKEYTLPNLLIHGGVCAMQADFASRVGKSMGVSAEYVRGESAGGDLHAWVMWVELKQATPTGLVFSLESHGRYRGDKYYVGHLNDPQTGQEITDRDMELRLQTVGLDTVAKRHAALVMQAYPMLCEKATLDTTQKLNLLSQTIAYSPGCEEAWYATARLFREASGDKQHNKQYQAVLNRLFTTFARVPDFTWKVFDDLAAYQSDAKQRNAMYVRLCGMYEAAERPDLACEARLKLADMLVEQEKPLDAVQGLAFTIKKFPGEGRYVPKMLDKIERLVKDVPDANMHLVGFYVEILPLVPQMRGNAPSPFAIEMFERATNIFNQCNQPQLAQAAQVELEKIKAGQGQRD